MADIWREFMNFIGWMSDSGLTAFLGLIAVVALLAWLIGATLANSRRHYLLEKKYLDEQGMLHDYYVKTQREAELNKQKAAMFEKRYSAYKEFEEAVIDGFVNGTGYAGLGERLRQIREKMQFLFERDIQAYVCEICRRISDYMLVEDVVGKINDRMQMRDCLEILKSRCEALGWKDVESARSEMREKFAPYIDVSSCGIK